MSSITPKLPNKSAQSDQTLRICNRLYRERFVTLNKVLNIKRTAKRALNWLLKFLGKAETLKQTPIHGAEFFATPFVTCNAAGKVVNFNSSSDALAQRLGIQLSSASIANLLFDIDVSELALRFPAGPVIENTAKFQTFQQIQKYAGDSALAFWIQWTVIAEHSEGGKLLYLHLTGVDVSAQKRIESDLENTIRTHQEFSELLPMIVFETNDTGIIEQINESGLRLLGYQRGELVGKLTTTDFVSKEKKDDTDSLFDRRIAGASDPDELELISKNGKQVTVLSYTTPKFHDGRVVGLQGVAIDISYRKVIEKELVETKTAAEFASMEKSRFLTSMSHELRTPLNAIIGFSQILKLGAAKSLSAESVKQIEQIYDCGNQLLALISNILEITSVDLDEVEFHPKPVMLSQMIKHIVALKQTSLGEKGLIIVTSQDSNLTTVDVDSVVFTQIILNLLSNAIKFSPTGETIYLDAHAVNDGHFAVTVTDAGPGILVPDLSRVFEDFFQSDLVREQQMGGTGIGLALTRRLVALHEGEIGVVNTLDSGAKFTLTLPISRPDRHG